MPKKKLTARQKAEAERLGITEAQYIKKLAFLEDWYTGPGSIIGSFKKKGYLKKPRGK